MEGWEELRFRVPDTTLVREFGEESVLLNLQTETYFGLDAMGTFLWRQLAWGRTACEICRAMTEEYEVTPKVAASDIGVFFGALLENRLVGLAADETEECKDFY